MARTLPSRSRFYGTLGLLIFFGAPPTMRTLLFGNTQFPCLLHAGAHVVCGELEVLGMLLALVALAARVPLHLSLYPRMAILALGLFSSLDTLVGVLFACRLHVGDIGSFGSPSNIAMYIDSFGRSHPDGPKLLSVALLTVGMLPGAWTLLRGQWRLRSLAALGLCAAGALSISAGFIGERWAGRAFPPRGCALVVAHPVAVNLRNGVTRKFSNRYSAELRSRPSPPPIVRKGAGRRPDIILLVLESWSRYHSRLFGGAMDWSPCLDAVASRHTYFTRFFANGYMSEHGLVACLAGRLPLPSAGATWTSGVLMFFSGFFGSRGDTPPLPQALAAETYQTAFLTPCILSFSKMDRWLPSIGFGFAEGNTATTYQGLPTFVLNGPADAALYARATEWIAQRDPARPFFLTLATTSAHRPWTNPDGGPATEESVMRYADAQAAEFLRAVEASGFLSNGIVIVVSDHRALTPPRRDEAPLGPAALSLIPMVVMGGGVAPGKVETAFQQIDIPNSVRWLVSSGQWKSHPMAGNFLCSPMIPSGTIVHHRNLDRNLLDVFVPVSGGLDHSVYKMNGDASRFVVGRSRPQIAADIDSLRLDGSPPPAQEQAFVRRAAPLGAE